jgi:hypothetical protein
VARSVARWAEFSSLKILNFPAPFRTPILSFVLNELRCSHLRRFTSFADQSAPRVHQKSHSLASAGYPRAETELTLKRQCRPHYIQREKPPPETFVVSNYGLGVLMLVRTQGGKPVFRAKFRRDRLLRFFMNTPPVTIDKAVRVLNGSRGNARRWATRRRPFPLSL